MTSLAHTSLALSRYMCQHIVGTEKTVKSKRLFNNAIDSISDKETIITSGSFGEGLEMKGSDFDIMHVLPNINICETYENNIFDPQTPTFVMEMDETKPGFSKLRLISGKSHITAATCIRKGADLYLSNYLFKSFFATGKANVIHGPCVSDSDGLCDFAVCVHCKSWITPARDWIHRAQNEWPIDNVKSYIVDHGVLFVPVGVKGSNNEELEWRISFSVGEKLLISSFNQTQLQCYALMKILLKDVIERDVRCKQLLCSYFLKTIIFWVSEELPFAVWKPANLIHCFLRCFDRLIYYVEHSTCPHYFIPENNLIENRISVSERHVLLDNLNLLRHHGWRCLLMSEQLIAFSALPDFEFQESFEEFFGQIWSSNAIILSSGSGNYKKAIRNIISHKSYTIKSYLVYAMSKSFNYLAQSIPLTGHEGNKETYQHYKTCLSYLLLSMHHDAVSGWLMLASFFYKMKQYRLSKDILEYVLSKCTPEKAFHETLFHEQYQLLKSCRHLGLQRTLKVVALYPILFGPESQLVPEELELEVQNTIQFIPPVAYAHFLSFLCYYHLGDVRKYQTSLRDINLTIREKYFIRKTIWEAIAYNYLGIASQLTGDSESARRAFLNAVKLDRINGTSALKRLQMMDAL